MTCFFSDFITEDRGINRSVGVEPKGFYDRAVEIGQMYILRVYEAAIKVFKWIASIQELIPKKWKAIKLAFANFSVKNFFNFSKKEKDSNNQYKDSNNQYTNNYTNNISKLVINIGVGSPTRPRRGSNPDSNARLARSKIEDFGDFKAIESRRNSNLSNPIGAMMVKGDDGKEYMLIPVN